jgi:hypothetical protein
MKTEIKFNHNEDSLTSALGIKQSPEEVAVAITIAISDWADDETGTSCSLLAEYLHKGLTYEIILLLATREVYERLSSQMNEEPMRKLLSILESFEDKGMDEDTERKVRDN